MIRTSAVFGAFLRRDWAIARSYRASFLMGLFQPLAGLVLVFYLGRLVDTNRLVREGGITGGYFSFAILGYALISLAQSGVGTFSDKIRSEQTTGTMEALAATPTAPSLLVAGSSFYELIAAGVDAAIYLTLAILVFGFRPDLSAEGLGAALLAVLFTLVLSDCLGIALASATLILKKVGPLTTLVTSSLFLLGGVYFPLHLLPAPLRQIGEALPFTWALDLFRMGLLQGSWSGVRVVGLIAACAVAIPLSLAMFSAALDRIKRTGTLAHY